MVVNRASATARNTKQIVHIFMLHSNKRQKMGGKLFIVIHHHVLILAMTILYITKLFLCTNMLYIPKLTLHSFKFKQSIKCIAAKAKEVQKDSE